jgi:sporulation protein YlmC with PRC-barrel domain
MAEQLLYLTELLGLKVFDLKGRRIGVVKDAALVPLVDPVRVDRYLIGGGYSWLTVRYDQIQSISLNGIYLRDEILTPYHSTSTCCAWPAIFWISRSSTRRAAR